MSDESKLNLTSKVNITECETFPQALSTATEEAGSTGGQAYPVVMFRQGKRISFSGALPMKRVESFLDLLRAARKGDSMDKLRAATNRPHIPVHTAPLNVYTAKGGSTIKTAYMVVPDTAPASPTDGQHRAHGIFTALGELDAEKRARFAQDGVAFVLTCESKIEKAHQDSADCSKTKQLPPAMLTVYDLRNRANGLVIQLVDVCPVFKDKVELDWLKSNPLWADVVQPKKDKLGNVVMEDVQVNGHTEKRPVMQLVTNRAPLNRAIYKASQAIGLAAPLPSEGPAHSPSKETEDADKAVV